MTWIFIGLVVVVVAAVAAVAVGNGAGLAVAQPDRPEVALPTGRLLGAADLETVELSVGLRGYRMDEVDDLLSRLAAELAERDERLVALGRLAAPATQVEVPTGVELPTQVETAGSPVHAEDSDLTGDSDFVTDAAQPAAERAER